MNRPGRTLLLLLLCASCTTSKDQSGQLDARWVGSDTGRLDAPAIAEWCDSQRRLEIRAIRGDTGLALVVYPEVVLSPDTYLVVAPTGQDSVVPSARVALRWFAPTAIKGFQGDSGAVVLERTDSGQLSGKVAARASSVSNNERVTLVGDFRRLAVVDQVQGCSPTDTVGQAAESMDADVVD